jgi:hypothetical protein
LLLRLRLCHSQALYGSRLDPDATASGKKRAAPAGPTLADSDVVQHIPWTELVAAGTLKSKSMDVLKQYLRHFKLATAGKKADLVDRVSQHVKGI